jgi:hypothetical protein
LFIYYFFCGYEYFHCHNIYYNYNNPAIAGYFTILNNAPLTGMNKKKINCIIIKK